MFLLAGGSVSAWGASAPAAAPAANAAPEIGSLFSILPKAFQKTPLMDFNVVTEMTAEGRKRPAPTSENPVRYLAQAGKFIEPGTASYGGKYVPPVEDLERAMQRALRAAGYVPMAPGEPVPALAVIFNYGSHAIDPPVPVTEEVRALPATAEEWLPIVATDTNLLRDVLERAELVGGVAFATGFRRALEREMENRTINWMARPEKRVPESPDFDSPFQMYMKSEPKAAHLVEHAFHTVYFVVASAYDFEAMQQNRRVLLWRTKMTVDAQGVSMQETLAPLIASASPFFGRETTGFEIVSKRISREGRVEIGTPTVVEEPAKKK